MAPASPALAACTTSGSTVTCSGSTSGANGFGNGTQDNLTINVQSGATVTGTANAGINVNNNDTVNNSGTVTGVAAGISANTGLTVINNGTVQATGGDGISATTATITNFGTIAGSGNGVTLQGFGSGGTITNYGTISGADQYGIYVNNGSAGFTLNNSGTITGGTIAGVYSFNSATINNTGTISGPRGIIAGGAGPFNLTNSGTIIGTNGAAIDFSSSSGDTLTLLPGSKIIGDIQLGFGPGDTVNIKTGPGVSTILQFGYCGCGGDLISTGSTLNMSGTQPFIVNGNTVVILDPTMLSQADKTLMFFTGNVSSLLGSRFGEFGTMGTPGATAFAAAGASPIAEAANSAFAGLAYAGSPNRQSSLPAAMAYDRATGTTVWSKAFVGTRRQDGDDTMLKTSTLTYGGAIGVDRPVGDNLLLGAFLGGGYGVMDVALNSQRQTTDYVFGGTYGRFDWVSHFLDFALSGGYLSNGSTRRVFNNAAPNGEESAAASYNAFYVTPEIAYGWRIPLAGTATLTPVGRLRYIAGHFNGYTETGSFANLTVNGRTVQDLEQRGELMLSFLDPLGHGAWLKTTATIGVLGLERLAGTTINTVVLGQNLSFAAAGKSFTTGIYGGLSLDYRTAQAISVFAAVDATAMSDNSVAFTAKSGTRISF